MYIKFKHFRNKRNNNKLVLYWLENIIMAKKTTSPHYIFTKHKYYEVIIAKLVNSLNIY